MKNMAGDKATFDDIQKALIYMEQNAKEHAQERRIGRDENVKNRLEEAPEENNERLINFRDVENLLKAKLNQTGYKPPHAKRNKGVDEFDLD